MEELTQERERLINELPWSANIYLPTEKVPLADQVTGLQRVVDIHTKRIEHIYGPQLRALRDRFAGQQRCFIIGNGPSLNQTDLTQLEDEVTFCVNGFFLKMPDLNWTPTFYVVEDHLVAEDRAVEINRLKGPIKLFPSYLGYCLDEAPDTIFFNHRARKSYPEGFDFSEDASKITYTGCTVTFTCMQLAHYLGFREIYLIGVDASYDIPTNIEHQDSYGTRILDMQTDDPNHFHPDYFGKGYRWHDPQVAKMLEAYQEAQRVTDLSGRPIYNATVGGQLEVFERRAYAEIFPDALSADLLSSYTDKTLSQAAQETYTTLKHRARHLKLNTHLSKFPKVALIDMTPASGITATGMLKSSLFSDWPRERLLQVYTRDQDTLKIKGGLVTPTENEPTYQNAHHVAELVLAYSPDVILYRPLPERLLLQTVFEEVSAASTAAQIIWMMDDWPAKLAHTSDPTAAFWDAKLHAMINAADARLSISSVMSEAYLERYQVPFIPIANGIEPVDWPPPVTSTKKQLRVRYAGNLFEHMSLQSLLNLAEAIERVSQSHSITFEIQTRPYWNARHGDAFQKFRSTQISTESLDEVGYRTWLSEADLSVIAYNFDATTLSYVQYSLANKMPELLASGKAVLAIGPEQIGTLKYLQAHQLGYRVTEEGSDALITALTTLLEQTELRQRIGEEGRAYAFKNLRLDAQKSSLQVQVKLAAEKRRATLPAALPRSYKLLLEAGQARQRTDSHKATPIRQKPKHMHHSRPKRISRFYQSWRGLYAILALIASATPAALQFLQGDMIGALYWLGPVFAVFMIFIMFAYIFTLIEDHAYSGDTPDE